MTSLDMYGCIQCFKERPPTFIIQSTSVTECNEEGPLRLVRVHIQLLAFLLGDIVFDNMRFAIVQLQFLRGGQSVPDAVRDAMDGLPTGMRQYGEFTASQGLFRIGVGGIMTLAHLFGGLDQGIAFGMGEASVANVNVQIFRNTDPIVDCLCQREEKNSKRCEYGE